MLRVFTYPTRVLSEETDSLRCVNVKEYLHTDLLDEGRREKADDKSVVFLK